MKIAGGTSSWFVRYKDQGIVSIGCIPGTSSGHPSVPRYPGWESLPWAFTVSVIILSWAHCFYSIDARSPFYEKFGIIKGRFIMRPWKYDTFLNICALGKNKARVIVTMLLGWNEKIHNNNDNNWCNWKQQISNFIFVGFFFRKVDHFGNVYFIIIVNIHNINI